MPTEYKDFEVLEDKCAADYLVLFARGTSQPQDVTGQAETLQFFQVIDEILQHDLIVSYESLEFDASGDSQAAIEAVGNGATSGAYHERRVAGSKAAKELLAERAELCSRSNPNQKYILGGYSLGAHVIREALFELDEQTIEHIALVALFGDPTFAASDVARGSADEGAIGIFGGARPQIPEPLLDRTTSWCDGRDPICSGGPGIRNLLEGEVVASIESLVKLGRQHELYPEEEMYNAAFAFLTRTHDPVTGGNSKVDVQAGDFTGRWESVAGCGPPDYDEILYLALDIASKGLDESREIERLVGVLEYYEVAEIGTERWLMATARLEGIGTEGRIDLKHVEWLSGEGNFAPIDIVGDGILRVINEDSLDDILEHQTIDSGLGGECFYSLSRWGQ